MTKISSPFAAKVTSRLRAHHNADMGRRRRGRGVTSAVSRAGPWTSAT
ncbi:MAG TPA: hypothetical protein VI365_30970 [Trebonia sp.]